MNKKINAVNTLIAINVVMYLIVALTSTGNQSGDLGDLLGLHFPQSPEFHFWQPITYLFIHGGVAHLLFNMYGLYAFGSVLEKLWGSNRFLQFYFISGLGAALVYTIVNTIQFSWKLDELYSLGLAAQDVQQNLTSNRVADKIFHLLGEAKAKEFYGLYFSTAVGASGAIYGILIAFALSFPQAKLMLIFLPYPIAAKYFVPVLIAADVFFGVTSYSVGNVAHFAHVGGALFGLLMMLWWRYTKAKYTRSF